MTRTRFHQGLDDLKQKLLAMGGMAEQAVERAVRAYQTRELSLCEVVLRDESKINAAERDVDEMSIDLLAMLQGKTRGNLTLEEQRLLENSLTELRFRYVQAVERYTKKQA